MKVGNINNVNILAVSEIIDYVMLLMFSNSYHTLKLTWPN